MESHAKLFGHPVHPMLVVFPLGLLAASLGFDFGFLATNNAEFAVVSFWMIGAGIMGGLLAAVFGAVDWWAIPSNTRANLTFALHAVFGLSGRKILFVFNGGLVESDQVKTYPLF